MSKYIKNQRGLALPMVMVLSIVIILLAFTAMNLVDNQTLMVNRHQQQEKALHYAEAGIYRYINALNDDNYFYNTEESEDLETPTAFESGSYEIHITPPTAADPVVTIRSTGWAENYPDITKTLEVRVYKREFVQNIYCSNDEGDAWWVQGDEIDGPVHTNGQLHIDGTSGSGSTGPIFHDALTYSGNAPEIRSGTESFPDDYPKKVSPMVFPATNSSLKTLAQNGGIYRNGRTCIYLTGSSMIIRNQKGTAETLTLPSNGVIYIDGGTSDNKWANLTAGDVFVAGQLDGRLTIAAANNIYITDRNPTQNWPSTASCGGLTYAGSDDMLGLIAGRYAYILHRGWPGFSTGYSSNNYSTSSSSTDVAPNNITIKAAIFALNGSFGFEDYTSGLKNTITLLGSVTQRERGAVGTFDSWSGNPVSGYEKSYSHDERMLYDMPPHFLEPMNSGWEIRSWRETAGS
ncbi:MAG TPA: hypothetical protein PKN87_01010 [Syntrophomonadaceae bacterium]|nr:hypothetical protein [Syntrophomonadaceae bacterium]HPR94622.1 hypothetical protein [Syntrophomonadaceae bacterium]